jgi:hypothetical protein
MGRPPDPGHAMQAGRQACGAGKVILSQSLRDAPVRLNCNLRGPVAWQNAMTLANCDSPAPLSGHVPYLYRCAEKRVFCFFSSEKKNFL